MSGCFVRVRWLISHVACREYVERKGCSLVKLVERYLWRDGSCWLCRSMPPPGGKRKAGGGRDRGCFNVSRQHAMHVHAMHVHALCTDSCPVPGTGHGKPGAILAMHLARRLAMQAVLLSFVRKGLLGSRQAYRVMGDSCGRLGTLAVPKGVDMARHGLAGHVPVYHLY